MPDEPPEPTGEGTSEDAGELLGIHPTFSVETVRPEGFEPKVGGLDVLPDGRIVLSTWDAAGSVYVLDNVEAEDRDDIEVTRIAEGLAARHRAVREPDDLRGRRARRAQARLPRAGQRPVADSTLATSATPASGARTKRIGSASNG